MTWMPDIRRRILKTLREHGQPLDQFALALILDEPPFRVRAELLELKRERLVKRTLARGVDWQITSRGERLSWGEQAELPL
jgi:DNA-binding GntR family transcriptional regulator